MIFSENSLDDVKREVREAKVAFEAAVASRSSRQRQVNDLLQRKASWTQPDVMLFTTLVQQEHEYEQAELRAKERSAAADRQLEVHFNELMRAILNRYHEEQVWSDKIRSASTYGSLGVMGLNLAVFILAIVIVEPWKRKRLGETFEERMVVLERENQAIMRDGMERIEHHFGRQEEVLTKLASVTAPFEAPSPSIPVNNTPAPAEPSTITPPSPLPVPRNPYITWFYSVSPPTLQDPRILSAIAGAAGGAFVTYIGVSR